MDADHPMIPSVGLCLLAAELAAETIDDGPLDRVAVPLSLAIRQMEREAIEIHGAEVPCVFEEAYSAAVAAQVNLLDYAGSRGVHQLSHSLDRVRSALADAQLAWGTVIWSASRTKHHVAEC